MDRPEFAETYSRGERIRYAGAGLALGALGLAVWKQWLLPWIAGFADTAPCRTVLGVPGTTALWFGLFVALPLCLAIACAITLGRTGLAVRREGLYPPRGVKVFRPTRIRRGEAARWIGYLHLLACAPLLATAVWGYGQATALSRLKGTARCPVLPAAAAVAAMPERLGTHRPLRPSASRRATPAHAWGGGCLHPVPLTPTCRRMPPA